jgi:hypothetical protein
MLITLSMIFVYPVGSIVAFGSAVTIGSVSSRYTLKVPLDAALCAIGAPAAGGEGTFHLQPMEFTGPEKPAAVSSFGNTRYLVLMNLRLP